MDFRQWIAAKGVKTLSLDLGQREGTIYMWSSRNLIPRAVWPDLLVKYPELGLNDLIAMEKRARVSGAA